MNPIERRVAALETARPTQPPVVRFITGLGDNVMPENPPSHTEDGRPIMYITWLCDPPISFPRLP
jgi:hypothetical protein